MTTIPSLVNPSLDADAGDIQLNKLYRGEYQSELVKDKVVPAGSIFLAASNEDPDPTVVLEDATAEDAEGVLVIVLKQEKSKSGKVNGEFRSFPFDGDDLPRQDNGKALDAVYTFIAALPETDEDMPVKIHMSRTSSGCAQRIITRLLRHSGDKPLGFRLKLKERKAEVDGTKTRWFVWIEEIVTDVEAKSIKAAGKLAELMPASAAPKQLAAPADQPGI